MKENDKENGAKHKQLSIWIKGREEFFVQGCNFSVNLKLYQNKKLPKKKKRKDKGSHIYNTAKLSAPPGYLQKLKKLLKDRK